MSFGMNLMKFRNGRRVPIPQAAIVSILVRHGCWVPELRDGPNEVGLPHETEYYSPIGECALLFVKNEKVTDFGLHRQQATIQCRTLLFSLIDEIRLTMFPDYGTDLYAREDVFAEVPEEILTHFSNFIVVNRPEDCA